MGLKEDYQALFEKQLKEWQAQAEQFKATAAQMEASARVQFEKNLDMLRTTQAQAWDNFNKFKAAHEGNWEQFRTHMEKAGAEVRNAVEAMARSMNPPKS